MACFSLFPTPLQYPTIAVSAAFAIGLRGSISLVGIVPQPQAPEPTSSLLGFADTREKTGAPGVCGG